jgi:hypothetical protein
MHLSKWLKPASIIMLLSLLTACGGGGGDSDSGGTTPTPSPTNFTVTATANDGGNITPTSTSVVSGKTASFTATPEAGYSIVSVIGCDGNLTNNTYTTAAITSVCSVSASFSLNEYLVTAASGDGGTISPENQSVTHGNNTTFTITPDNGYSVDSVTGCDGTLTDTTYTTGAITSACSVNASFSLNEYQVTATSEGSGAISPESQSVTHGNNATFIVTPATGYSVSDVTGCDGSLTDNTYTTGAITSACSVNASFSLNEYRITASSGGGGVISPESQMVAHGDNATFTVTPDNGYDIFTVEGCNGTLDVNNYITDTIIEACSINATFNQVPDVNAGDDVDIIESDTIQQIAIATDGDGTIASYEWQQLSGPAFEIHQFNTDTLVTTAPLVEQDVIAIFQVTVTDEQGAQNTDEISITIKLREPSLVNIEPTFDIPSDITSVNADDLSLMSLAADGEQVNDSEAPTLLIAKDTEGTVLLSFANQNGGFLEEAQGNVSLSIDSTAVTLIAVSAGYPVSAIGTSLVEQIKLHEQYQDLILQLNALLDADKNFLDRLFDYPDVVKQIKLIANTPEIASKPTQGNVSNFTKPKDKSFSRKLNNFQQSTTANSTSTTKDDFYCTPLISWPCSPWEEHEAWQWFGDAKGIKAFYPESYADIAIAMIRSGFSPSGAISYLTADGYIELLSEATQPPFLASSLEETAIHAIANPNFVNYAMEMYTGDEYQSWYYTPSNSTMVKKLLRSGAEYRKITAGNNELLNPTIDKVRFQRYRLSYNTNSGALPDRALAISFMNTLGVVASSINLFADASEFNNWIHDQPVEKLLPDIAGCTLDVMASIEIYEDTNANGAIEQAISFLGNNVTNLFKAIPQSNYCLQIGKNLGGKTLKKVLERQSVKAGIEFVANLTPAGWAKLAFDGVNDTVPVFTSYFSGNAASSEYYLTWDSDTDGVPYISAVSDRTLPSAKFTYTQKADFTIELDASSSVKDPSTSLSYEWLLNNNVIGSGEMLTHNFEAMGNYTVTLNITDGFDNKAIFDAKVKVSNGLSPVITSLTCSSLGDGNVEMSVNFDDADNNISNIYWYNEARNPVPVLSKSAEEKKAIISFATGKTYAFGKVVIEDNAGNSAYRICKVKPNELVGGRYIVKGATVVDTITNLEWQRCYIGEIWSGSSCQGSPLVELGQDAFNITKENSLAGNTDWRLPTTNELKTLVYCSSGIPDYWNTSGDKCQGNFNQPTIFSEAFPSPTTPFSTLSSSFVNHNERAHNDRTVVWAIYFSSGWEIEENNFGNIRLVRNTPSLQNYQINLMRRISGREANHSITNDINDISCGTGCDSIVMHFNTDETVTLTASSDISYGFEGWAGDCDGDSPTCTLLINREQVVLAKFRDPWSTPTPTNWYLNVSTAGSGFGVVTSSPSGINCGNNCSADFSSGSTVTLTANPDSGYAFGGWSGACSGNNTTCTVSMNSSKSVTAQFIDGEVRDKTLGVCDVWSAAQSGGYGTTVDNWDISTIPANATFDIKFDAESIPDKFTVEYAGATKLDTGWRGSSSYNGDPLYPGGVISPGSGQEDNIFTHSSTDSFRVTVLGLDQSTAWDYQVRCRTN